MQEKFFEFIEKAKKTLQTADHLTYMTFPLLKDKRLLFKILEELNESLINMLNAILQYEYLYKRINLSQDSRRNLEIFFDDCASRYKITEEQAKKLKEIINLYQKHKKSPFEFVRNEKVVIMSDNLQVETITIEKLKNYIMTLKDMIRKTEIVMRQGG